MKKRVLILLSLAMMISLAAIAYSAAVTNPGHGVEEVGSGSSPYASRMWNAANTGYQEYYTGPAALRSNIPWFGTINAETTAAQNAQGDYCAIHTTPTGVFINCLNNATNITLTQSYSWNGTNFTKNDTIRNESHVFEEHLVTAGPAGTTVSTTLANPNSGTVTQSCSTTSPPTCSEQAINPGGLKLWSIVNEESAGAGTSTWEWLDGANANAGFEETTRGDGTTGKKMVNKDPATGNPEGGEIDIGGTGLQGSAYSAGAETVSNLKTTDANGGVDTTITRNNAGTDTVITEQYNTGNDDGSFTVDVVADDGLINIGQEWTADDTLGAGNGYVELNSPYITNPILDSGFYLVQVASLTALDPDIPVPDPSTTAGNIALLTNINYAGPPGLEQYIGHSFIGGVLTWYCIGCVPGTTADFAILTPTNQ